jgi:hypothetical protein
VISHCQPAVSVSEEEERLRQAFFLSLVDAHFTVGWF